MVRVIFLNLLLLISTCLLSQKDSIYQSLFDEKDSQELYNYFPNGNIKGIVISEKSFNKKISSLNSILKHQDTLLLNDTICTEVIRVSNTLFHYRKHNWSDSITLKSISTFNSYTNFKNPFGVSLYDYIINSGEAITTKGMGLFYKKYNVFYGGRVYNRNSYYSIK